MLSYFAKVLEHWEQTKKIANKGTQKSNRTKVVQAGEFCDVLASHKVVLIKR